MIEKIPPGIECPEIASEIHEMYVADQTMRKRQLLELDYWDESLDGRNTARMKEIIAQIGWPTIAKVGEHNSNDAWLLVQHADHDVAFQEMCLNLMKETSVGEIDVKNIAYLEDRVRINKGQAQLYGTQFTIKADKRVPKPIEDEKNVEERRSRMNLNSIEDYAKEMNETYGSPKEDE